VADVGAAAVGAGEAEPDAGAAAVGAGEPEPDDVVAGGAAGEFVDAVLVRGARSLVGMGVGVVAPGGIQESWVKAAPVPCS
jgi:hypothetical protein